MKKQSTSVNNSVSEVYLKCNYIDYADIPKWRCRFLQSANFLSNLALFFTNTSLGNWKSKYHRQLLL